MLGTVKVQAVASGLYKYLEGFSWAYIGLI